MKTYEESEYAHSRLTDSVVRLDGVPIYVREILNGVVDYLNLKTNTNGNCPLSAIDINPVPLGYANINHNAIYLCRTPMRQDWRQGLRSNSLRDADGNKRPDVSYQSLVPTIMGIYPSISQSFASLRLGVISVAFSRSFAVGRDETLWYKGMTKVGNLISKTNYHLSERFSWVEEDLNDTLQGVES